MKEVEMDKCEMHGDPYVDCEGEVKTREFCGEDLCSAHMGAEAALIAVGARTY